ncbi:MAG: MG2 domain-containing protein [Planctomycetota bacterium]|nr:MG2 domain-containing protein [Planctomycetota bacterium]
MPDQFLNSVFSNSKSTKSLAAISLLVLLLVLSAVLPAFNGADDPVVEVENPLQIPGMPLPISFRTALLEGSIEQGLEWLDQIEKEQPDRRDDWLWFRSSLLQRAQQIEAAIELLKTLENSYPESPWLHKARLQRSQLLMKLKRYGEAQKILEEETSRLRSGQRIEGLAQILLDVADRISADPDLSLPDPPAPQFGRARNLYIQAAELAPPTSQLEESLWGLVRCSVQMKINGSQLMSDCDRYLSQFDPRQSDASIGSHVFDVLLARARATTSVVARRSYQELIFTIDAAIAGEAPWGDQFQDGPAASLLKTRGDALFDIAKTYSTTDLKISALKRFLADAPQHEKRIGIDYRLGELLRDSGQSETALSHWHHFIDRSISGDQELLETLKRSAQFQIGNLLQQLERFEEARLAFTKYGQRAPDGPDWARSQEAIITIDASIGERFLDDSRWEEGRLAIDNFSARYPLDRRSRPLLLRKALSYSLEAKELQDGRSLDELSDQERARAIALYQGCISQLKRLAGKYPDTPQGLQAMLNIGIILEVSLLRLEEAVAAYKECFGSPVENSARMRLANLTEKRLQIETNGLLRSNEAASFSLNTRNIQSVEVRIYPLDIEAYFRKYYSRDEVEELDLDLIDPWKTIEVEIDQYARYKPCHQKVTLPVEGSGTWAVMVASEKYQATTLVVRTDIDIVVKAGRREVLIYAQDMLKGQPAPDVDILMAIEDWDQDLPLENLKLHELKTGSDGTVRVEFNNPGVHEDVRVLALRGGDSAVTGFNLGGTLLPPGRSPRVHSLTDRATYRPGDTVHWRTLVREVDKNTGLWYSPEGAEGQVSIATPNFIEVAQSTAIFSQYGTIADSFTLPFDAPHGTWTIKVSGPDNAVGQVLFMVEDFSPLAIDLRIEPEQLVHVRGEMIHATISGQTWFGEPLTGTPLMVRFQDGHSEQFTFDDKGLVKIEQDSRDVVGSVVHLHVTVPEYGISRSTTVTIADSMWQLAIEIPRESGDYIVGETVPVLITATDASGQPVERDVTVRLVKKLQHGSSWAETTEEVKEVRTDKNGTGEVRLPLEAAGKYSIVAEGLDRIGNRISSTTSVQVSGDDEERGLIWLVEKTRIDVGEPLQLELQNTRSSSPGLLTIVGDGILDYRVIQLDSGRNRIDLDVLSSMYPEATVSLSMMDDSRLHEADVVFRVRKQLLLEVIYPQEPVTPGSEVTLEVITKNLQGEPVAAEIALAVVDVAVDDLYPGWFQELKAGVNQRIPAPSILRTSTSCNFQYHGITEEIAQALLDEVELVEEEMELLERRVMLGTTLEAGRPLSRMAAPGSPSEDADNFSYMDSGLSNDRLGISGGGGGQFGSRFGRGATRSRGGKAGADKSGNFWGEQRPTIPDEEFTAFWDGTLLTSDNGTATITFTAPPRSTTWRIRAQAIGDDDLFGNSKNDFVVRADIFIDPILPSSAMEGDQIEPRLRIVNSSGIRGKGTVSIRIGGGDGAFEIKSELVLVDGMQEITMGQIGPLHGDPALPVEIVLEIDGEKQHRTIRQIRTIAVRPWGLLASGRAGGSLEATSTRTVRLPGSSDWLDRTLQLWIGSNLDQILIDLAADPTQGLRIPPDRDLASRAARLEGAVAVLEMASKSGNPIPKRPLNKIRGQIQGIIGQLSMTQNSDGGWGWAGGPSMARTSAAVLIALQRAQLAGFAVADVVLSKASSSLEKSFRNTESSRDDIKVQLLRALSFGKSHDFGTANRLHRSRSTLSNSSLAYLVETLAQMDRRPMAKDVARTLIERRQEDGSWSNGTLKGATASIQRDPLVISAMALHACTSAGLSAVELASSSSWLEDQRPWQPGRGSGLALAALARVQGSSIPAATDCEIEVFIDGDPARLLTIDPDKPSTTASFDLGDGRGETELKLVLRGTGKPHWAALLSGRATGYPAVTEDAFSPRATAYLRSAPRQDGQPVGIGFSVTKKRQELWRNPVRQLPLGSSTEVMLEIRNQTDKSLSDPETLQLDLIVPAGMSLVEGSLKGRVDSHRLDGNLLQIWTRTKNHFNVSYSLVGTVPGEYRVPPPIIRSVSEPSRISLGQETQITVLTRGRDSEDEYRATPDEIYNRGSMHWDAKQWREARQLLTLLWEEHKDRLRAPIKKEVARILLLSAIEAGDNSAMVSFFEVLKEQDPDLNIDFENVIRIGEAYRILGEHPRSIQIFLAVIQETFGRDLQVTGVLEQQDLKASLLLLLRLVMEYPDLPSVLAAEQTLADIALSRAGQAAREKWGLSPAQLSYFGIELLRKFIYMHGDDPTAADAGLNLVSAFLDLEDWQRAADESGTLAGVFKKSRHVDSFRYTRAVALWSLDQQQEALQLLQQIADARYETPSGKTRTSENRDLALYIIGQIHHAANQTKDAAKYYEQVKDLFEDARASLARFQSRELNIDEISEFRPGEEVQIELRYRNIEEAEVLAYKVNLMTLALREQDLSRVTEVNLSGISPTISTTVQLGGKGAGGGAMQASHDVTLPIEDVGAYLVIVRGEDIHTSCLVLINQMELVVEDTSGNIRIQSIDPVTDALIPGVQIRILDQGQVQSGTTDRRGLFVSDTSERMPTVIARRGTSDYAFFRGSPSISMQQMDQMQKLDRMPSAQNMEMHDYLKNVIQFNDDNRHARDGAWQKELKKKRKGIQVKQAAD